VLQSSYGVHNFTNHAGDGEIGGVEDLFVDDLHWTIRYLVVDTGKWLPGRRVLISPASVRSVDWAGRTISVDLTCDQVRNSPDAATDKPVSRQHEEELSAYYGWPSYWSADPYVFEPMAIPLPLPEGERPPRHGDPHLRSARAIRGYHIEARDGPVGRVSDLVFDDATWRIVFLVVDAGSRLHQRLVLVKPEWVEDISWDDRRVAVNLAREAVRTSPPFSAVFPISSQYVEQLMRHYRRAG